MTDLPILPNYRSNFALCLVKADKLLLTGGHDKEKYCVETWLLDLVDCKWVKERKQPDLIEARGLHSSCACDSTAFVFGGAKAF